MCIRAGADKPSFNSGEGVYIETYQSFSGLVGPSCMKKF